MTSNGLGGYYKVQYKEVVFFSAAFCNIFCVKIRMWKLVSEQSFQVYRYKIETIILFCCFLVVFLLRRAYFFGFCVWEWEGSILAKERIKVIHHTFSIEQKL